MICPVFPLNGAILFPNTNLPLNIFEERYIQMVDYALSNNRIIGMIQKKENNDLFPVGCLGKITNFTETSDRRYQINLEGISRFKVKKILDNKKKFTIIDIKFYGVLTLIFFPFNKSGSSKVFKILTKADQLLFKLKFFKYFAWSVLITAKKN